MARGARVHTKGVGYLRLSLWAPTRVESNDPPDVLAPDIPSISHFRFSLFINRLSVAPLLSLLK